MALAVITAIYGRYDYVPPVPVGFDEAVLVSDRPITSSWTNIVWPQKMESRLAAKLPKFRPDLFVAAEKSCWVDASLRDPSQFLAKESHRLLNEYDIALFRHPSRTSVHDEVIASKRNSKYNAERLQDQYDAYVSSGFADNLGLFACGVIARRHNSANQRLGNAWLTENFRWSVQDQISFPHVLVASGVSFGIFDEPLVGGPLAWVAHRHDQRLRSRFRRRAQRLFRHLPLVLSRTTGELR